MIKSEYYLNVKYNFLWVHIYFNYLLLWSHSTYIYLWEDFNLIGYILWMRSIWLMNMLREGLV